MSLCEQVPGDKLERILAAAAEVFVAKGFHEARVEEIAERAGIGKGTIYLYFPGKQELFLAMIEDRLRFCECCLREAAGTDAPFPARLAAVLAELMSCVSQYSCVRAGDASLPPSLAQRFREQFVGFREQVHGVIAGVVRDGVEQGVIGDIDPSFAAIALAGAAQSFVVDNLLTERQIDPTVIADATVRLFVKGAAPQA